MHGRETNKLSIVGLLLVLLSLFITTFNATIVEASTAVYEQTYVYIDQFYREDDTVHVVLRDNLAVKDMTYEYTHYVDGLLESDLITVVPKKIATKEYTIDLPSGTQGVRIWKIKHQVEDDYYKNKYTQGPNEIGELDSVKKKNYITVTADDLVSYEYSCQNLEFPWWSWSPVGFSVVLNDYLFREKTCASYTWYFNVDIDMDEIIDVDIEYATFMYSEILWGTIQGKTNYQSHGPMKIQANQNVFDYKKFIDYANDKCKVDFSGGTCNNILKEQGEAYFQKNAVGSANHTDENGNSYNWYVQVTLDDLLEGNNVLWGAYEKKAYLQEVALLSISYYFEGEAYFDISVLDEDTGEANIIPDPSPIDRFLEFVEKVKDWFNSTINFIKKYWKWFLIALIAIIVIIIAIFAKSIFSTIVEVIKFIGKALKWILIVVFFPISIPYFIYKKKQKKEKEKAKIKDTIKEINEEENRTNYNTRKVKYRYPKKRRVN